MDFVTRTNFNNNDNHEQAWRYTKEARSLIIIGSPGCTMPSTLHDLNKNKGSPEWNKKME